MEEHRDPSPNPPIPLSGLIAEATLGTLPLDAALDFWCSRHGLRHTDVARMIGKARSSVSQFRNDPERYPETGRKIEELIGYRARPIPDPLE